MKPTINRALHYVYKEGDTCCFRFLGDPMVLVSEEKGVLTPLAALGFKAQEQQGQCTTIFQRGESFHGLISVASQAFQFDLTNLCGSLDHDNENRQLNFNILQDGKLINEVNVVRAWETVEVKSDQQHQNRRLILEEDTKMVDNKPKTITIQENEATGEKKGAVFEVVISPQTGAMADLFKKKLQWVSADKVQHLFMLKRSNSSKHQVDFFGDGTFGIKQKQEDFRFSFGSDNRNEVQAFNFNSGTFYSQPARTTELYSGSWGGAFGSAQPLGAPSFSNGIARGSNAQPLSVNQPQYSSSRRPLKGARDDRDRDSDRQVMLTKNSHSRSRVNSSFGAPVVEQGSLEWGQELEESNSRSLPNEVEDLDPPLSMNTAEGKQDLILQSNVGKVAFGDQISVNSSKCAAEFDYSLTTKICRLELSVQPRLSFFNNERVDWVAVAKEFLRPKKPEDTEIFKADECVLCLEEGPDLLLFPCHHQCMHARCESDKIGTCPFCRAKISAKLLIGEPKAPELPRFSFGIPSTGRFCVFQGCSGCVECRRY